MRIALFVQIVKYTRRGAVNTAFGVINALCGTTITAAFLGNVLARGTSSHFSY